MPRSPGGAALALELADMRAGGKGPLAGPGHDDGPDVAGLGGLQRVERRPERLQQFARHEVERRVDERQPRDPSELEVDERFGHEAPSKSAARPIGPVA